MEGQDALIMRKSDSENGALGEDYEAVLVLEDIGCNADMYISSLIKRTLTHFAFSFSRLVLTKCR